MAQLTKLVEPFGEVNVHRRQNGEIEIVATILIVPDIEGARTALALDASASMKKMYGVSGLVGNSIFAAAAGLPNVVEPVARTMASYLAKFSSDGKVYMVYWACSPDGSQIEEIGHLGDEAANCVSIVGPKRLSWGRGTKLLPPLKLFVDRFKNAPAGGAEKPAAICVFVTDGILEDLQDVKTYCVEMARLIGAPAAIPEALSFGVGEEVDEGQMEELDDMFEGSGLKDPQGNEIDLWDHKLASEMRKIEEIFAEVVSEDAVVTSSGRITNQAGQVCKDYPDGVSALLRFTLPAGSTAFTLEFPGGNVTQDITEGLARAK